MWTSFSWLILDPAASQQKINDVHISPSPHQACLSGRTANWKWRPKLIFLISTESLQWIGRSLWNTLICAMNIMVAVNHRTTKLKWCSNCAFIAPITVNLKEDSESVCGASLIEVFSPTSRVKPFSQGWRLILWKGFLTPKKRWNWEHLFRQQIISGWRERCSSKVKNRRQNM